MQLNMRLRSIDGGDFEELQMVMLLFLYGVIFAR